ASGTAEIGGVQMIKLRTTIPFESVPPFSKGTIWVKRANYVPVRIAARKGKISWRMDLHWLSPTKANLALLRVPIPAGFRRVPIKRLSDQSSQSCTVSSSHPHKQVCTHSG